RIDGVPTDVTRTEPSVAWSAGALISSGTDLNHFYLSLLSGTVVPAAQLPEMLTTLPAFSDTGIGYGLGIAGTKLPCGTQYYGHNGEIPGYLTISGATRESRAVTLTLTTSHNTDPNLLDLLTDALCP
ncbi:serine hydrolase, partial [Nocardia sp. JMUB6875]|uniref:serine hydrolase n=1 Tax=Nocardia sp. JMUB6875 TaxID=3158170 RepID=UPI0034E8FAB3